MHLSPREVDKLLLHNAGVLAQKRLARGLRLNYPEAVALIATQLLEFIRDGRSVADLMDLGRWHFRQFVRGDLLSGFGKPVYSQVNLNGDQLYGFSSGLVSGTHKEVLRLETVAYAPFHILGFRFAPVLLFGFGTIGEEGDPLFSGRIYNAINLGILVRNENLLVKTFEVSLSFYPFIPEHNGAVFQVGSFNSFALNARGFAFTRPDVVGY